METLRERQDLPDVCTQQRASAEFVKQIRKLRWIGMEEEASRLQIARSGVPFEDCVLAEPQDTGWPLMRRWRIGARFTYVCQCPRL